MKLNNLTPFVRRSVSPFKTVFGKSSIFRMTDFVGYLCCSGRHKDLLETGIFTPFSKDRLLTTKVFFLYSLVFLSVRKVYCVRDGYFVGEILLLISKIGVSNFVYKYPYSTTKHEHLLLYSFSLILLCNLWLLSSL